MRSQSAPTCLAGDVDGDRKPQRGDAEVNKGQGRIDEMGQESLDKSHVFIE
jgi:hypothetical protein